MLLLLLSTILLLPSFAYAKECPSRSSIQKLLIDAHIPGAAIVLVNSSDILYQEAFGYHSISPLKMMSVDESIFVLASISKTFIAVAVMQLVESNQLDLDKDINEYLSSPNQRIFHPQYPCNPITLRQLLSHSASIGSNLEMEMAFGGFGDDGILKMSLVDACFTYLSHNASNWLPRQPGTVKLYSNVGTSLAALIVERVARMPYEQYIRQKIVKPLGIDVKKAGFRLSDIENQQQLVKHYIFNATYLEQWPLLAALLNMTRV